MYMVAHSVIHVYNYLILLIAEMTEDISLVVIDDDDDDDDDKDDDEGDDDGSSSNGILTNKEEHGCFEFSIGANKVKEVNILRDKVQELYGVKVQQDIKAKEMGKIDKVERQWFSILGPLENCRLAKAFILAQCDPGESAIFDFDPKLYQVLSSEVHKSKIEKESNTVLLFDNDNEGNVIIQGSDEMCVLVAMSLLEEIIYKTSVNVASYPEGDKKMVRQDENSGGIIVKREETCSYANENEMELDIVDLESDTGDVAINVMMSPDPEIQRLIKCGREKHYTDDEIREVLQKSPKVPKASDFIRALHTCRNLKAISDAESNNAPLGTNTSPAVKAEICNATQKFESKNAHQTENDFIMRSGNYDISVSNICPKRNYLTAQTKELSSSPMDFSKDLPKNWMDFSKDLPKTLFKIKDHDAETLSVSSCSGSPICISDAEQSTEKVEDSQQRNRMLFIEQSTASHLVKQNSTTRLNKLDSASSSGSASAELSQSKRQRKKKKKKNQNITDLVKDDNQLSNKYQDTVSDKLSGASVKTSSSAEFQSASSKPLNFVNHPKSHGLISAPPGKFSGMPPIPVQPEPRMSYPLAPSASATAPISSQWPGNLGNNNLRYVVIDGSNVAMAHGNGKCFSCRGIGIAVEHFRRRGHKEITVFVPQYRRQVPRFEEKSIKDQHILEDLKEEGIMTFTPSRRIPGKKNIVCYDDRFILRLAEETGGVVVSNDNYRDLYSEKWEWSKIIETRVLSFTFVGDRFMLPDDPLGRDGPNLDEFLSFPVEGVTQVFANQPRVLLQDQHPVMHNVGSHSVPYLPMATPAQRFGASYQQSNLWMRKTSQDYLRFPFVSNLQPRFPFRTAPPPRCRIEQPTNVQRGPMPQSSSSYRANAPAYCQTVAFSAPHSVQNKLDKRQRLESETARIKDQLVEIFPNQEKLIDSLLLEYEAEQDIAKLTEIVLNRMEEN